MRRRPLCLIAVFLVCILWVMPKDVWLKEPDIPSGQSMTITGTVAKREQKEDKQAYYLKQCQSPGSDSEFSVLAYLSEGKSYPIGCEISIYGNIYQLNTADNPGQFDAEAFYQSQGILYTFQGEAVVAAELCEGFSKYFYGLQERLTRLRNRMGITLTEIFSERDSGILKAVLLGDKSTLREEDSLLYQKNGISHLLAISGLHISMIGAGFYKLLRKLNLTYWEAGIPSGILLLLYGMMTGFGISTIRAVCMFLVMIVGDMTGKVYDMASAMALAAIILLLRNPLQARQAGFLLSFGAVCGVCVVYPILQSVFPVKKKLSQAILFSVSLTLATAPLSIHFFYEYPFYSIFLNFIAIPLMPFVMGFGAAGLFTGMLSLPVGKVIGVPAHLVLSVYELFGKQVMKLPLAVIRFGAEEPWQLVLYYVLLFLTLAGLWYGKRRIYVFFLPLAVTLLLLRFRSPLEVTMLDVGQGDGIILRLDNDTTCLIDGGSTNVKNVGTYRILPYLKHEGITKLDYVIFTHLDEDHISGTRELVELHGTMNGVEIGTVFFPDIADPDEKYKELWIFVEQKGIDVGRIGAGDLFCGEKWEMVCHFPIKGMKSGDKNETSTVLQLNYEEFSMLLTGDLGLEGEASLLNQRALEDIDVWKVSHHGSKYSGGQEFLECIRPNVSLISVGRNNYGHPSEEILERLSGVGSQVWTTLDCGAIFLESDGETYRLSRQR